MAFISNYTSDNELPASAALLSDVPVPIPFPEIPGVDAAFPDIDITQLETMFKSTTKGTINASELPDSIELHHRRLQNQATNETPSSDDSDSGMSLDTSDDESMSPGSHTTSGESETEDDDADSMSSFIVADDEHEPEDSSVLAAVSDDPQPAIPDWITSALSPTDPIDVTEGWESVKTWRKDPVLYDVQYIVRGENNTYSVHCIRSVTSVGEQSLRDMFGDYVISYFLAFADSTLTEEKALRIVIPDIMQNLISRRKRQRKEPKIISYLQSSNMRTIVYDPMSGYRATFGDSPIPQDIILASVKRGESCYENVKFIAAVDEYCSVRPGKIIRV